MPSKRITPKEVKLKRKTSRDAARMDGRRSGRVTRVHTCSGVAPRERAVASSDGFKLERAELTIRMMMVVL